MKQITLILILLFGVNILAQDKISYSEVVQVENISKDELFNRAIVFFSTKLVNIKQDRSTIFLKGFNSLQHQIIQQDINNGQIILKGQFNYNPAMLTYSAQVVGIIEFTMFVYVKDGRYKYELTDFIHTPTDEKHFGRFYNNKSLSFTLIKSEEFPNEVNKLNKGTKDKIYKDVLQQVDKYSVEMISAFKSSMEMPAQNENNDW